ncbi:MAG: cell division protein FtsZ [Deltaproteobacteria bacterium]|nr:cell division protein FtsZ [Deltaproteobacteria bacterium]
MGLSFDLAEDVNTPAARIKVVGCGGAGGNAIRTMMEANVQDVEFIVANTDIQALTANPAPIRIQLGRSLTKGLGAGANPDIGKKAALEDIQLLQDHLQGADMVFVTAGMGGGTGTGAAPIIAQVARDMGALTVGVVTKPFMFEGKRRSKFAEAGLEELANHVDTLITIPNQRLVNLNDPELTLMDAFRKADEVLVHAVQGISDLIQQTGIVNVDFADVKAVMTNMGMALMGIGYGRGERRASEAATAAINSPLLDNMSVDGATGILINFTGGPDMRLGEIDEAATMIMDAAHEDANIIFGSVVNPEMRDVIKVTVIATGFGRVIRQEEVRPSYASRIVAPPLAEQRPRIAQSSSMIPDIRARTVPPEPAPTRRSTPAQPQTFAPRERAQGDRHSVIPTDADLDIPTFLRNNRGGE